MTQTVISCPTGAWLQSQIIGAVSKSKDCWNRIAENDALQERSNQRLFDCFLQDATSLQLSSCNDTS